MFGEDPKQFQSDEFFGLFAAFLVSFAVSQCYLLAVMSSNSSDEPILSTQLLFFPFLYTGSETPERRNEEKEGAGRKKGTSPG